METGQGKIRKELKSIAENIKRLGNSLEQKYKFSLNHFMNLLNKNYKYVYFCGNLSEDDINEIPAHFARVRNANTHSNIESLDTGCVAAVRIMRILLVAMILEKSGIDKEKIKDAVDSVMY